MLLKKLAELGDTLAKKVFKEEIAKRLEENYNPTVEYLTVDGFLKYLNQEELELYYPQGKKKLNFASKNLNSFPPLDLLPINDLQILNLTSNKISEIPNSIGKLNSLRILDISENILEEIPSIIGRLKNLIILSSNTFL